VALTRSESFVHWFRAAAPYIHAFRDRVFVIAFGGEVVHDPAFTGLIHDFNLLESLGVRLVLVHGARPLVEARLKARGIESQFVRGLRVTDAEALACVKEANGVARVEIEALLSQELANSPMAGSDIRVTTGNFVTAQPVGVIDGIDLQHTGVVRKIDVLGIQRHLENEEIVLMSPVGYSPTGEIFNLSLEDVATSTAIALGAEKLIFLMEDALGVVDKKGKVLPELTAQEAARVLESNVAQDEDAMLYLPCAMRACRDKVARCHLINRRNDGALLLELFTREGIGTMVTRDPLESLRRATIDDVGGVLKLIEPLEAEGILVKRGRELLEREIGRFSVLEHDGTIIGCVALYPFPKQKAAELACLAVNPAYQDGGRGERLLKHVEARAKKVGVKDLFVLTTRSTHWFVERDFVETEVEKLPEEKKNLYNYQRRSKVFVKRLSKRGKG
jgi:amino-acid N-acetyltransferase